MWILVYHLASGQLRLFSAVADALEWIIVTEGGSQVEFVIHYLDDFLFEGRPGSEAYGRVLDLTLRDVYAEKWASQLCKRKSLTRLQS